MKWLWINTEYRHGPIPKYRVCGLDYPLVMTNRLLLKMAIEIVDLPIKNGDFP